MPTEIGSASTVIFEIAGRKKTPFYLKNTTSQEKMSSSRFNQRNLALNCVFQDPEKDEISKQFGLVFFPGEGPQAFSVVLDK